MLKSHLSAQAQPVPQHAFRHHPAPVCTIPHSALGHRTRGVDDGPPPVDEGLARCSLQSAEQPLSATHYHGRQAARAQLEGNASSSPSQQIIAVCNEIRCTDRWHSIALTEPATLVALDGSTLRLF